MCVLLLLLLYVHGKQLWSGQSVSLTTLFLGSLRPRKWLTRNAQLPFSNQCKGENDCRNDFMVNVHESIRPNQVADLVLLVLQSDKLLTAQRSLASSMQSKKK